MIRPPRFSVTIPIHNGTDFLGFTLRSVLAQDPGPDNMQIIVVDDCSTDSPLDLIRDTAGDRIEYVRSEEALGPARAFNRCVTSARGELIHLLHADDLVVSGFYETVDHVYHSQPDLGLFVCRSYEIDPKGRREYIRKIFPLNRSRRINDFYHLIVPVNPICTPGVVVPSAVYRQIGLYDERLSHTQDWNMWLRISSHYPVWYEDQLLTEYRVHPAADTSSRIRSGEYIAEAWFAVQFWLERCSIEDRGAYLEKMQRQIFRLAMKDLSQHGFSPERIRILRQLFAGRMPDFLSCYNRAVTQSRLHSWLTGTLRHFWGQYSTD